MKLLNFNIIKLTICLIVGIIIGSYFKIPHQVLLVFFLVFSLCFTVCFFWLRRKTKSHFAFGILVVAVFVLIGITRTKLYDDTLNDSHYINSEIDYKSYQNFSFKISKRLKPDTYNTKFFAEIISINGEKHSGEVLLNLDKDSLKTELNIDDIYYVNTKLTEVVKPKNPFQFNYNAYLKQRNVYHQMYLQPNALLPIENKSTSIYGYADMFRNTVNSKLKNYNFSNETLSIINALLLGQRQTISTEVYNNYVNAGVIHILAVSGLHVGIIFIILTHLLKPLHYIRHGKFILKPIAIILILWAFAFIAGLSPSVTRAVTMFSIVAMAGFLKRPRNIINTLVISAFILLLFKPIYLFDVGFQMSYLAVLAIVTIQPLLYKTWQPRSKIVDYFWQIFTVTIAAQIGVVPISIFYFHQFPSLFFVSNLVILPFLALILGFGILIIFLSLFEILPQVLADAFNFVIETLNGFIAWIARFEEFLFEDISFSIYHVITSYLIIISTIYLWKNKTYKALQYMLFSVLVLSMVLIYTKHKTNFNELVIYNKSRATLISKKKNKSLAIISNLDSVSLKNNRAIKNYKVGNFIKHQNNDSLKNVYQFEDKLILVIDSLGVCNTKSFKPEIVLLRDSPRINLERLIDSLQPYQIIADASNYKSYVVRWKATCANKKIPFHSTYEKGAFVMKE